jgi:uncharacterized metal-binding protein
MNTPSASVVLVPCNGYTLRGHIAQRVAQMLRQELDDIEIVDLIPLMAGREDALQKAHHARALIGLAGCRQACERSGCQQFLRRGLDQEILLDALVPAHYRDTQDIPPAELEQLILQITSSVLGQLSAL